jgi:hypothetical protein
MIDGVGMTFLRRIATRSVSEHEQIQQTKSGAVVLRT